jgi:hypothetical protein
LQTLSQGPKTCSEFLQIAKSIADQLAATGNPVPDEELISFVLNGLNPPFTSFITTYSFATREHQISFGDFQDELLSHEMLLNQQQTKVTDSSTFALTAQRPANPQLSKGKGPMYPLARHAPRGYPKEPAMAFNPGLLITNTVGVLTLITIRSLHSLSSCILPISSILNQTCSTTRGHCNLVTTTLAGHLILVFYLHLRVISLATIQEFPAKSVVSLVTWPLTATTEWIMLTKAKILLHNWQQWLLTLMQHMKNLNGLPIVVLMLTSQVIWRICISNNPFSIMMKWQWAMALVLL